MNKKIKREPFVMFQKYVLFLKKLPKLVSWGQE